MGRNSYSRFSELRKEANAQQHKTNTAETLGRTQLALEKGRRQNLADAEASDRAASVAASGVAKYGAESAKAMALAASAAMYRAEATTSRAEVEWRSAELERIASRRAENETALRAHKDRRSKLKEESLELSVLGTRLLARLAYAPLVFLCALFIWLLWLGSKRRSAHALAAEHALAMRAGATEALHGAAMWFSPLPTSMTLSMDTAAPRRVVAEELRRAVGWSEAAERRQVRTFRVLAGALVLLVLHVGWIALEFTSPLAASGLEVVLPEWVPVIAFLSLVAAAVCAVRLVVLSVSRPEHFDGAELPPISRREWTAIGGLSVLTAAGVIVWRPGAVAWRLQWLDARVRAPSGRRNAGPPRFVATAKLERRRIHRRTVVTIAPASIPSPPSLVWHDLHPPAGVAVRRTMVAVHHARQDRSVRLLSSVSKGPKFEAVDVEAVLTRVLGEAVRPVDRRTSALPLVNPARTWSFETYALELLAQAPPRTGPLDRDTAPEAAACRVLWTGVQLTMQLPQTVPLNLRLADLLAGLCVRVGLKDTYLQPLRKLAERRIDALKASVAFEAVAVAALRRERANRDRGTGPSASAVSVVAPFPTCSPRGIGRGRSGKSVQCGDIERLEQRLRKWDPESTTATATKWRKHWTDRKQPMTWHDPMQTVAPSAAVVAASAASASRVENLDRRNFLQRLFERPPTPVLRQRKTLIA